jgi:thiol-disulfide isomerase/thioredoxin
MKRNLFIAFIALMFLLVFTGMSYAETFSFPYAFSAQDLNGTIVTEKTLGEKELFFVHYWATWCGPCVREMPDLAAIVQKYGDRVGFIALLDDYSSSRNTAIQITRRTGVSFTMVDARHKDFQRLLQMVQSGYVPTTILIDKSGRIVGEQIIGSYGRGYANFIDKALK